MAQSEQLSSFTQQSKYPNHVRHHNESKKSNKKVLSTRVFACGYNYNYQFGIGNNDNYSEEIIELDWCIDLNIANIYSGLTHICYLSFTGNYYFCGQIDRDKLGIKGGGITTISKPTSINKYIDNKQRLKKVAISRIADGISARHIIVISSEFRAYSMGLNQSGQLGLGHFKSTTKFKEIHINTFSANFIYFDIIDASGGESHSAFVLTPKRNLSMITKQIICYWFKIMYIHYRNFEDSLYALITKYVISTEISGRLYVCGSNKRGQLGIGPDDGKFVNKPIRVKSGWLSSVSIVQVSCGENHTVCLSNRGRVYFFGDNYYGQSGAHLNHYENVYHPLQISHFKKHYKTRIVKISSGKSHCIALDKMGKVYCWGSGVYGELGIPILHKRVILPELIDLDGNKCIDVRCGVHHSVALTNNGKLYCWGSNSYGQCLQNIHKHKEKEIIREPMLANINIDDIDNQKLQIYKVFCGYYSTLILVHNPSSQ